MKNQKNIQSLTKEELNQYSEFIKLTIEQLSKELKSTSKTKSNQAATRLDIWEKKLFDLNNFLISKKSFKGN
jgi:hypothetical protein